MPGEDIQSWSVTAANNANADTSINWTEGQPRASVNNSARSQMAAHAKQRNLLNGSIITGGAVNALTFTSGVGYTAVPTGLRVLLAIGPGLTSTSSCTLNMDGIGPVTIKEYDASDVAGGRLVAGSRVELIFDGTYWIAVNNSSQKLYSSGASTINGAVTIHGGLWVDGGPTNLTGAVSVTGSIACTGSLTAQTAVYTGSILAGGGVFASNDFYMFDNTISERSIIFQNSSSARLAWGTADAHLRHYDYIGNAAHIMYAGGNFQIAGGGFQPGGGLWNATSDARIKTVLGDYSNGLAAVNALTPVRYKYKGNDTPEAPNPGKTVPYQGSPHYQVATNAKEYIGLLAQDVEPHLPELVTQASGYIDGAAVSDIRMLDTTPLIYALVNSVKELLARIEALEAKG